MQLYRLTKKSKYVSLLKGFSCNNNVIDNFLKNGDALDENQGITYILLSDEKNIVIGYFNIEVGRVDQIQNINGNIQITPMGGSVNINYLAVDSRFQHTKIGEIAGRNIYIGDYLVHRCEMIIKKLRKKVGISFITLYSTKEGLNLYKNRNGYEEFEDDMSTFIKESDKYSYKCVGDLYT